MWFQNNIMFFVCSSSFPPVVTLSCKRNSRTSAAQHISQAGSLWDHSACQGCCSYLSLPVRTQVPAPLHPPRSVEGVWRPCGMQVRPAALDTVECRCLCARVHLELCVILHAGRPVSRCSSSPSRASLQTLPWVRKQETTSSEGKCVHGNVTLDDAQISLYLPVWNRWSSPVVS